MAITAVFEVPGMNADHFDKILAALDDVGQAQPDGRLFHVASPTDGGWLVVDVWESEEKLGAFADILMPIIAGVGVTPPQPRIAPVHYMHGG
ncbi:MAG: antibiotic biosynthesis monooxygenase [Actinobacteria bacterium]|nr:antibiotic biosynthesis monooxygenase [Actinomycetota bacterium]